MRCLSAHETLLTVLGRLRSFNQMSGCWCVAGKLGWTMGEDLGGGGLVSVSPPHFVLLCVCVCVCV